MLLFFPQVLIFFILSLLHNFYVILPLLTSLSGLPQIPPGRRITCHQWRRLPPTMTSTWPQQGYVPRLVTPLLLCCFLEGQRSSLTRPPGSGHNAFEWPITQTCLLIITAEHWETDQKVITVHPHKWIHSAKISFTSYSLCNITLHLTLCIY